MPDNQNQRVAVYLDFDNIVLSWYDRVHGRNSFSRDRQRISEGTGDADVHARLQEALVNVGAIIDYASSFGTIVLTRAYADWSAAMNAEYRTQLVARAVDLVQLFPAAAYAKNGADIRLAVDAVEDMFRLEDLTHVVIVAGDSDYVPLAQRCRRLGRYVVGIGVAGSTAKALAAACDEFASYDDLPGVERPKKRESTGQSRRGRGGKPQSNGHTLGSGDNAGAGATADPGTETAVEPAAQAAADTTAESATTSKANGGRRGRTQSGRGQNGGVQGGQSGNGQTATARQQAAGAESEAADVERVLNDVLDDVLRDAAANAQDAYGDSHGDGYDDGHDEASDEERELEVTGLLIRALWLSQDKDDSGWLYSSAVKQQMRRMDPSFNEKALGFRSFSDFLKSRANVVELEESGHERLVRLAEQAE